MEPMFRATCEMNPELYLTDVDVVISREVMARLFEFITQKAKNLYLEVEIIGGTAVFVRKDLKTMELTNAKRRFKQGFLKQYTRWDTAVEGSSSHYRIAKFDFGGLKYLLRFHSNGYFAKTAGGVDTASSREQGGMADLADTASLSNAGYLSTFGKNRPIAGQRLVIRNGGHKVDQGAAIEIRTQSVGSRRAMEKRDMLLSRLWMCQTPNLVIAYHRDGRFLDVRTRDVREDLKKWENSNNIHLQKLVTLVRRIIDAVQNTITKKCRVTLMEWGQLEIREHDVSHQSALPDDLYQKLKKKDPEILKDLKRKEDREMKQVLKMMEDLKVKTEIKMRKDLWMMKDPKLTDGFRNGNYPCVRKKAKREP